MAKELVTAVFVTALFWITNPIKLNLLEKAENFRQLWGFGWKIFAADQIESIGNQLTSFVIGKNYTATDLGLYQKAEQFQFVFSQTLVSGVNKVIFTTLAKVQGNTNKLKADTRK